MFSSFEYSVKILKWMIFRQVTGSSLNILGRRRYELSWIWKRVAPEANRCSSSQVGNSSIIIINRPYIFSSIYPWHGSNGLPTNNVSWVSCMIYLLGHRKTMRGPSSTVTWVPSDQQLRPLILTQYFLLYVHQEQPHLNFLCPVICNFRTPGVKTISFLHTSLFLLTVSFHLVRYFEYDSLLHSIRSYNIISLCSKNVYCSIIHICNRVLSVGYKCSS